MGEKAKEALKPYFDQRLKWPYQGSFCCDPAAPELVKAGPKLSIDWTHKSGWWCGKGAMYLKRL